MEKSGIELMAQERQEVQINKKGFTAKHSFENPQWYGEGQLPYAAAALTISRIQGDKPILAPKNWDDDRWLAMLDKPYKQRLIIAGTFCAAELDRLAYEKHWFDQIGGTDGI